MSRGAAVNRDARLQLILFMLAVQQPGDPDAETSPGVPSLPPKRDIGIGGSLGLKQGMQTPQTDSCR